MSIDKLKAVINKRGGIAHANRFEIYVIPPASLGLDATRDFTVLCESCTLPGRQITTIDYQLLQQSYKIPSGFINEEVSFTFILTNDYYAKKAFEKWSELVIDYERYKVKYRENYSGTIYIRQLSKLDDSMIYETRLIHAFPTSMGAISLDNNSENTVQRFTVTVAYENFENTTK